MNPENPQHETRNPGTRARIKESRGESLTESRSYLYFCSLATLGGRSQRLSRFLGMILALVPGFHLWFSCLVWVSHGSSWFISLYVLSFYDGTQPLLLSLVPSEEDSN